MTVDMGQMIIQALCGAVYGVAAAHLVIFLFNNIPDSYFDNPKAHIGMGPEKGQRVHSYSIRYLRTMYAFFFMGAFLTEPMHGFVSCTAIWILTLILLSLWFYAEIPITMILSLLLMGGAMVPYLSGILDMLSGAVFLGLLSLILTAICRKVTGMNMAMGDTVLLGTTIGLVGGFVGAVMVGIAAALFTIALLPAFKNHARRLGFAGYNKEAMEKIAELKEKEFLEQWLLYGFGRTPLALCMCGIAILFFVVAIPVRESFAEFVPWI